MELNAKLASLEDEVKLLKGEVKLILSEIRTAILGQDNPFAEPGQALRANPGALESRPPIRVVRVPAAEEEALDEPPQREVTWEAEPEPKVPDIDLFEEPEPEGPSAPPQPIKQEPVPEPPVAIVEPAPAAPPLPAPPPVQAAPAEKSEPRWSLITIAGLAVWAEEASKQIGPERLQTLMDLCEFSGYLSAPAKEALMKVASLGQADEPETPASVNDCLVVLAQLDALLKSDEPIGQNLRDVAAKWQQSA